jgi:hypothetical protein
MAMHQLEASDEFGLQGIADREELLQWLDSWLQDPDSLECKLEKFVNFKPNAYI